jgi:hypothetical protein
METLFQHLTHRLQGRDCRGVRYRDDIEAAQDYVSQVKTCLFLNSADRQCRALCRELLPDAETMDILGVNEGARATILRMRGEPHDSSHCFDRRCRDHFDENHKRVERSE